MKSQRAWHKSTQRLKLDGDTVAGAVALADGVDMVVTVVTEAGAAVGEATVAMVGMVAVAAAAQLTSEELCLGAEEFSKPMSCTGTSTTCTITTTLSAATIYTFASTECLAAGLAEFAAEQCFYLILQALMPFFVYLLFKLPST